MYTEIWAACRLSAPTPCCQLHRARLCRVSLTERAWFGCWVLAQVNCTAHEASWGICQVTEPFHLHTKRRAGNPCAAWEWRLADGLGLCLPAERRDGRRLWGGRPWLRSPLSARPHQASHIPTPPSHAPSKVCMESSNPAHGGLRERGRRAVADQVTHASSPLQHALYGESELIVSNQWFRCRRSWRWTCGRRRRTTLSAARTKPPPRCVTRVGCAPALPDIRLPQLHPDVTHVTHGW